MLEKILQEMNNWFELPDGIHDDTFTIADGRLALPFLQNGQYFRIVGSVLNDGLYQYPAQDLTDETFTGAVWALAIPKAVILISEEVANWNTKNAVAAKSPFQSESFNGYSYSRATGKNGGAFTWKDAFREDLNPWRKL